jgi:hypothetical protein
MMFARRTLSALMATTAVLCGAGSARASLTTSEQAQLRQYVAGARITDVGSARAIAARSDLSLDESTDALKDAFAPTEFTEPLGNFVRLLVFGDASEATRPMLTVAVTRALVAHADAVLSKHGSDLDQDARALDELNRMYGFFAAVIADPSPSAKIPRSSFDACVKTLAEHLERNPRWLKADASLPQAAMRVRAQMEIGLVDMMIAAAGSRAQMRRVDAANRLGLVGARRRFFVDLGILVLDTGKADDARVERMRAIVERLALQRTDLLAIAFATASTPLVGQRKIATVRTLLEASTASATPAFGDEVEAGSTDATTLTIARDLARFVVQRTTDGKGELAMMVDRDLVASAAKPFGRPEDRGALAGQAAALALLLTDAPRAMDLAFVRYLGGDQSSAALFSDVLGLLAGAAATGAPVQLGKPKVDGSTESMPVTNLRTLPGGAVIAFEMDHHAWSIDREPAQGKISKISRDGKPLSISMLPAARIPSSESTTWSTPGLVLVKLHGSPKIGVAPGPRLRLLGVGEEGYDAATTPAPSNDVIVEADVSVENELAGIVLRTASANDGFRGAALVLTPGAKPQIALVLREEDGFESFLAAPRELTELGPTHVRLAVKGTKVEATVGAIELRGTIPASFAKGDIGFFARKGSVLNVTSYRARPYP